jgi:SAM-dependent methyltransferase
VLVEFVNVYADNERAKAYARLEFPGTYYLAFRDIPAIIGSHVRGGRGLDFGCGTGRSTRFLRELGFEVVGVDISPDMLRQARELDPGGDYRLVTEGPLDDLPAGVFDVVLSAFTFDNIPTEGAKVAILGGLRRALAVGGVMVNLVSSPEIYTHEWASFSTKGFAGNFVAKAGDSVYTVMLDVPDRRPVRDVLWPDEAYRRVCAAAALTVAEVCRPLATGDEAIEWANETAIPPWVIYVLRK